METSIYTAVSGDGVEAHVFERSHRTRGGHTVPDFVVRILDADAGQWLPDGEHFRELEGARIYADYCVR
jgi:hypothetical protein